MEYFHFSAKEYEALRYSYDRKYVYILKSGRLYYRRLAKGRIFQDDLKRIFLSPAEVMAIKSWLKAHQLIKSQTLHFPKEDEGLNLRYTLNIQEQQKHFAQLYTGADQHIGEKMPELDKLWRFLQRHTQPTPSKIQDQSEIENPNPSVNLLLRREDGSGSKVRKKTYELKGDFLKIKDELSGQCRSFALSPYEKKKITRFLKEENKTLKEKCASKPTRTALLDEPVKMNFQLDLGGILVSQSIHGMYFSLIDELPFLLLELIEAEFLQIAKRATSSIPHQAISLLNHSNA